MDVAQLRWFQQVADGVTVTEISDLEGVSQSGVSRALGRLEDELGVPLLRRSGRVLRMTRAGAAFKHYVDRSLATLDDGFAVLTELTSPDLGTVAVTFQPSLGGWLVPDLVAGFHRANPRVTFDLRQVRDDVSGRAVLDGSADVELTTIATPVEGVRWRALAAEPLSLAVPRGHRLADRRRVPLADAAGDPFITLRRDFALRRTTEDLCAAAGFVPAVAFEGDDVGTLVGFVAAGLGVAVVPRPSASGSGADDRVRYLAIDDAAARRTIGICWAAGRKLPPAGERFRRHVLDTLRGADL